MLHRFYKDSPRLLGVKASQGLLGRPGKFQEFIGRPRTSQEVLGSPRRLQLWSLQAPPGKSFVIPLVICSNLMNSYRVLIISTNSYDLCM